MLEKLLASEFYKKLRAYVPEPYFHKSFAQEGEDLLIQRIFSGQKKGFYVDIGAHHPKRFSNTFIFYSKGWRGINVDACPGSMHIFKQLRPRDINLEIGISNVGNSLDYYQFDEPALNGFSADLSLARERQGISSIINTTKVETLTLKKLLSEKLPPNQTIDFLTVDVEGLDLDVLMSNDWDLFRPRLVLAEVLVSSLDSIFEHPIVAFMRSQGYRLYSKSMNTAFFITEDQLTLMR